MYKICIAVSKDKCINGSGEETRNRIPGCWFHLAYKKHKRQAVVNLLMNLQVSIKCR
jgi:hypothetical protein